MAKSTFVEPVDFLTGKLHTGSKQSFRVTNGVKHTYTYLHPFTGPRTNEQKQNSSCFGQAIKQASAELKDPDRKAMWEKNFEEYKQTPPTALPKGKRPCVTLRAYITSCLYRKLKSENYQG